VTLAIKVCDLRGAGRPGFMLSYPEGDLVVVSGLPGSGKSTLMRRVRQADRVDSQDARSLLEKWIPGWIPYGFYRPLARAMHLRRLRRAVLGGGSLVVHDCGDQRWVRGWLGRTARRQGRSLHLVLLDASAEQALDGQRSRGRTVSRRAFDRHRAAWRRLVAEVSDGKAPGGAVSAVLLDRETAQVMTTLGFGVANASFPVRSALGPTPAG
jgi:predicted kinase